MISIILCIYFRVEILGHAGTQNLLMNYEVTA